MADSHPLDLPWAEDSFARRALTLVRDDLEASTAVAAQLRTLADSLCGRAGWLAFARKQLSPGHLDLLVALNTDYDLRRAGAAMLRVLEGLDALDQAHLDEVATAAEQLRDELGELEDEISRDVAGSGRSHL